MIPAGEIVNRIRIKYESESNVRWDDDSIMKSINEGLDDLSLETGFYERRVVLPIQADVQYYDLRGFTPETVLSLTAIYSTSRRDWLAATTAEELDRFNPLWEQSEGDPVKYFTRGIYWFGVWPRGRSDTQGFFWVYFRGLAPHFTHPQSVLDDLPDDFVPALEDYALYDLSAQDGMTDRALRYWDSYKQRKERLAKFVDGRLSQAAFMRMGEQR